MDANALDVDVDGFPRRRRHLAVLHEAQEPLDDLFRLPSLLRSFQGQGPVREVLEVHEPFAHHGEALVLGGFVGEGTRHRVQEQLWVVLLNGLNDAVGEVLVVNRYGVEGPPTARRCSH